MNRNGQGTIEYLIIIAIVVVIALVVVGLLTGFFETGTSVNITQQQIGQQTQNIALGDSLVNEEGEYLLEINSNEGEIITVNKVTINGVDQNFYTNNSLNLGDSKLFSIGTGVYCVEGAKVITENITISYTNQKGISKTKTFENVTIPCTNYSVDSTSAKDTAGTEKIVGLAYCKHSGWESNTTYRLASSATTVVASGCGTGADVPNRDQSTFTNCFVLDNSVSNITIDCQDRIITGNGSWTGATFVGTGNVTVQNCQFDDFSVGIQAYNNATVTLVNVTADSISCGGATIIDGGGNQIGSESCDSW